MKHQGGCHCGKVRYEVESDIGSVIACNCSHCDVKGLLLTFAPEGAFSFTAGEDALTEYRFNKHQIAHLFCSVCGVQPVGKATAPDGTPTVAVNVRTLDTFDPASVTPTPVNGKDF